MEERGKGQPRSFLTEKDFANKFDDYIQECITKEKLANIAGFCVFADIDRDTFYAQKDYYSYTFKKINEKLEDVTINAKINDTFKIFYMKNKFKYRDKTELDNVTTNINISTEDKELLDNIKKRLDE